MQLNLDAMLREGLHPLNGYLRIDEALTGAAADLEAVSDSARLDAELLLALALDVPRSYLFAHPDDTMDPAAAARFHSSVDRRIAGVPLAYLSGEKEFWSMPLMVSPDTLVPRPETELLVDQALQRIPRRAIRRILDLGTGSGCVALAIARERPACELVATDLSAAALAVARANARQLGIPNIEFLAGNWTEPVVGREFDLVVSNPPYVATGDPHLDTLCHEPRSALEAGPDGLDAIRRIAACAADVLVPNGALLFEHGAAQADAAMEILAREGWQEVHNVRDMSGLPRVTVAQKSAW